MVYHYDPEPERYYDWMLWKLRQEKMKEQDDPMDDITESGKSIEVSEGVVFLGSEDGANVYQIQSGNYKFGSTLR